MEAIYALLADAANVSADNKINILGSFNRIISSEFPARHPYMVLVLRFEASPAEFGQTKEVEIHLLDPDGHRLLDQKYDLPVPTNPPDMQFVTGRIVALRDTVFPAPGRHAFHVLVNGEPKAEIPVELVKRTAG